MVQPSPFYMVHRTGGDAPAKRHNSQYEAECEAKRLALANPGDEFFVLAAVSRFVVAEPVRIERYDASDTIPF